MRTLFKSLTILIAFVFACVTKADELYENSHNVMIEVIKNGQASGVMGGEMAKKFAQQFSSNGTLLFESKRLFLYKQAGCARIEVNYTKQDIATPNGNQELKLATQINYCLDGRAPQSLELAQ
jgi:hypothetical protein